MSKVTVKVPTGIRPVVARHTLQVALNRSVPAITDETDRTMCTFPAQSKNSRLMTPTATASTNEFGTARTPRTARTPVSREPAGTKIVDFGENVDLQPRGRFNVRGVGADGFFPPVKLRAGTLGVRFSTSAGSVRSCKSAGHQIAVSPTTSSLNVELAPAKSSKTSNSNESESSEEWLLSARSESKARTHLLQDRPPNPYNTRAVVAATRETFSLKEASPSSSQAAFRPNSNQTTSRTVSQDHGRPNKDAAWVRSFKVRQKRHNRVREILDSRPVGLIVTSPIEVDSFR